MAVFYGLLLALVFIPMTVKLLFLVILLWAMKKPSTDEEHREAEKQRTRVGELALSFQTFLSNSNLHK
jgi:hypothetical protein